MEQDGYLRDLDYWKPNIHVRNCVYKEIKTKINEVANSENMFLYRLHSLQYILYETEEGRRPA